MIPPQAMLMQPMLIHTIDVTSSLAPVMLSVALATIVCGAVLVALGYDARRANPTGAPARGVAETNPTAPSLLDLPIPARVPRAA